MRWLRRFFWLGVFSAGGYAGYQKWVRQQAPASAPRATDAVANRPPFVDLGAVRDQAPQVAPRWVAPRDGECPKGYPVKANDNSGIYHVPGGRFYARTVPERCYANPADAIADGYRPAKA